MNSDWEGGCRCGDLRFRATKAPLVTMACHCRGRQRMTGSAFSVSAGIPTDAFEITQGVPITGGLHGPSKQQMCPRCLSWVLTRPAGADWIVMVRSVLFDQPDWSVPLLETWTSERLPWATTPAVYSFDTVPTDEAYARIFADFAQRPVMPSS